MPIFVHDKWLRGALDVVDMDINHSSPIVLHSICPLTSAALVRFRLDVSGAGGIVWPSGGHVHGPKQESIHDDSQSFRRRKIGADFTRASSRQWCPMVDGLADGTTVKVTRL